MKSVYKFVTWEVPALEDLKNSVAYQLLEKLNRGEKLTREEKSNGIFGELWYCETYWTGQYRLMGYVFDFGSFLKSFLVKIKDCGWREIKAFDRTSIRKNAVFPSRILKIIDLPESA